MRNMLSVEGSLVVPKEDAHGAALGSITVDIPEGAEILEVRLLVEAPLLAAFLKFTLGITVLSDIAFVPRRKIEHEYFVGRTIMIFPDSMEFVCFCEGSADFFLYKRKEGNEPRKDAE